LESNLITNILVLQTITMTFLSMGEMAGNPSSPVGSTTIFVVGGSRGEGSTSPVTFQQLPKKIPTMIQLEVR